MTQLKGKQIGILVLAVLGVVAPAWTGTVNSFNQGDDVDDVQEKTDYSYKLLSETFRIEKESVVNRLDRQNKRIERLEAKLDRLLMTFTGEMPAPPPPPPEPETPKKLELPETLDKAMEQKSL